LFWPSLQLSLVQVVIGDVGKVLCEELFELSRCAKRLEMMPRLEGDIVMKVGLLASANTRLEMMPRLEGDIVTATIAAARIHSGKVRDDAPIGRGYCSKSNFITVFLAMPCF
jgi:hypothetical protein